MENSGTHNDSNYIYNTLINAKRAGEINIYTSIVWDINYNVINISTESGRVLDHCICWKKIIN